MKDKKVFLKGLADGMPICLGYLSVSFAFGIFSVESGLSVIETLLISMLNVTSAGQLSAVPIIVGSGSFAELALTQIVINLRYSLMSVSMSQKFDGSVRLPDRFGIAFVDTDEVFAVATSQPGKVGREYMFGLILTPYLGWSAGTLAGALAGDIFPAMLTSALGVAIYGMFIAIVLPPAKKDRATALCVLFAMGLSCLFRYTPWLSSVSGGFVIIICAVLSGALFALVAPIKTGEEKSHDA